jgi:hypothetical protein
VDEEHSKYEQRTARCVTSQLENLGRKVLENCREVDYRDRRLALARKMQAIEHTRSACTNTLSVVALLEHTVDTTNRELETGLRRTRLGFGVSGASLAALGARFSAFAWR